ncbi:hypothetical protein RISK_003278 [Rhodopirellula islandica]|uniref:Uncharacterized protein n=1 Tax=Rhodopirellula islandica TaxID=595434 RepID=A0A0J1BDS4_RHOIS|nr:hypothetical protein RISK_003278 [Rhodopirellula islandica]
MWHSFSKDLPFDFANDSICSCRQVLATAAGILLSGTRRQLICVVSFQCRPSAASVTDFRNAKSVVILMTCDSITSPGPVWGQRTDLAG